MSGSWKLCVKCVQRSVTGRWSASMRGVIRTGTGIIISAMAALSELSALPALLELNVILLGALVLILVLRLPDRAELVLFTPGAFKSPPSLLLRPFPAQSLGESGNGS